jgi:L-asparaginase
VKVLGTGGTIASRATGAGVVASVGAESLLSSVQVAGVVCTAEEVLQLGSYRFHEQDLRTVAAAAVTAAADGAFDGVVVTHGTDTMEESAFLADLVHAGSAPIVFCGAQRNADEPDTDGPRNLTDAIRLAAHPSARDLGTVICMAGRAWPAREARKLHTSAVDAFGAPDAGAVATVAGASVRVVATPRRELRFASELLERPLPRVDLVTAYAGIDGAPLHAAVERGARGIVVAAFGSGNVTDELADAICKAVASGVPVVVTSRCSGGRVVPTYGGPGGGDELARNGAIFAGALSPPHARLLLALQLSCNADPATVADAIARCG